MAAGRSDALGRARAKASPGPDAAVLPFQFERRQLLVLEVPLRRRARPVADEDLPGGGSLLETRGGSDRVADDDELVSVAVLDRRRDHGETGVDADVDVERRADAVGDTLVERGNPLANRERGAHRPLGVVLMRDRRAEDCEHCVADVLLEPAVAGADLADNLAEALADQRGHV